MQRSGGTSLEFSLSAPHRVYAFPSESSPLWERTHSRQYPSILTLVRFPSTTPIFLGNDWCDDYHPRFSPLPPHPTLHHFPPTNQPTFPISYFSLPTLVTDRLAFRCSLRLPFVTMK